MKISRLVVALIVALMMAALCFAQGPCDKLKSLSLPDTSITAMEYVPSALYNPPPRSVGAPAPPPMQLPGYCRVALVLAPSKDSHIESEVWLPVENWNGKLQVVGNGGWAGIIRSADMGAALKEGYASASTDTGHKPDDGGGDGKFALGHPEKIVDFGYRSLHETTVKAKAIISALYDKGPKYSYYNSCLTGGRQGLMEASRYPEDFDAIVAGAPANPHIHLHAADIERYMELRKDPGHTLSKAKLATLHKAIMNACDGLDGVKDGLLENPEKCKFDPASLLCKEADADSCLNAAQVEAVTIVFSYIRSKKSEIVWTGFSPGGELQYSALTMKIDPNAPPPLRPLDTIRILGYQDLIWDWRNWDLDRDLSMTDQKAGFIDVHSRDLRAFKARGGKLLLYHGWSDPGIPAGNTVNFYKGVLSKMGAGQDD